MHLHPAGLLRLDYTEQQRLVDDFARVFAGSPWELRALGQRELLLSGPDIEASAADPAYFAGSDPTPGLPRGEGAGTLRRLGAEMEMWLYEHPLNRERAGRGELPVTTFWLWGADPIVTAPAAVLAAAAAAPRAQLYGSDTFAEALWRLQGGAARALPAAFDAGAAEPCADSVFLYPLLRPEGLTAAFLQLEQHWLPGALRAVRQRRTSVLRLLIGQRLYSLRWFELVRFWRRRRPWWEIWLESHHRTTCCAAERCRARSAHASGAAAGLCSARRARRAGPGAVDAAAASDRNPGRGRGGRETAGRTPATPAD